MIWVLFAVCNLRGEVCTSLQTGQEQIKVKRVLLHIGQERSTHVLEAFEKKYVVPNVCTVC